MSVSASASLLVGFDVTMEDFWTLRAHTDKTLSCPKGHTRGAKAGKHCSECGGKFAYQETEALEPSAELQTLCRGINVTPAKVVPDDAEHSRWTAVDSAHLDGLEILSTDGPDHDSDSWCMGLHILSTGDLLHGEDYENSVPSSTLEVAIRKVSAIRDKLGLSSRTVKIYLIGSCG